MLDLISHGRGGPGASGSLTAAQIDFVRRTVQRALEVMLKFLSGGPSTLKAVANHVDYIGRKGTLELETEECERVQGRNAARRMLDDWDLDLDELRPRAELQPPYARKPPRLVYKLLFSMPAGTPPEKMEAAARNFGREEFSLQHRYAFVLHTDEPHPHVHLVFRALSEQGVRLNVTKAMLHLW